MSAAVNAGEPASYINPFWNPQSAYSSEILTCSRKPQLYRGLLIFHRYDQCHDVVLDGVCITMRAGPNGARQAVDTYLDDPESFEGKWMRESLAKGRERLHRLGGGK